MNICVAQIQSFAGEISRNIEKHLTCIDQAVSQHARMIVFPELSITGYEPKLASDLATSAEDPKFNVFQKISDSKKIVIAIGMPIKATLGIQIGMIIFTPGGPRKTYSKQLLHFDELPYFVPGHKDVFIQIDQFKIAPAICYESLQIEHAEKAVRHESTVYVASVAKSARGVDKAFKHYPELSRKFSIPVLMANNVGPSDDFVGHGKSAAWDKDGKLLSQLNEADEGLVIFDLLLQTADQFSLASPGM